MEQEVKKRGRKTNAEKLVKETTTTTIEQIDLKKENELLKTELETIKQMLLQLNKQEVKTVKQEPIVQKIKSEIYQNEDDDNGRVIAPNELITIVSLKNNPLYLTTESYGRGTPYSFSGYGDTQPIIYTDLMKIVQLYKRFAEQGYFYIANKKFIRLHGLERHYKNIFSPEKIEEIMQLSPNEFETMFRNLAKGIQDTIADKFVNMIADGEYVDMNLIFKMNNILNKDLNKVANELKEIKTLKENI